MEENKMRRFTEDIAKFADKPYQLYFATSNSNKFKEMQFLGRETFSMQQHSIEVPEIQGTVEEIIEAKIEVARRLSTVFPILVDDTALQIEALNGWPGPYVKEFLESFKPDGIVDLVQKVNPENMKARAICSLGYLENRSAKPIFGYGFVEGILKHREDGIYKGFGFDPVLYPFGDGKAFGDMTMEEKGNLSHRAHALLNLCQNLVKQKGSGDS
uniref:Uncharacterized protein n=1 Tax=Panagrolaimus sp. ES5 TaxID=591445 RepID=A0AC34G3J6_9BILA